MPPLVEKCCKWMRCLYGSQPNDRNCRKVIYLLVFMFLFDPTGLFVLGNIGILPTRVSPLEATTVFLVLANIRKTLKFVRHLDELKLVYVVLLTMIFINALRGIATGGVTAVNSSRAEVALLLIPLLPAIITSEARLRNIVRLAFLAIIINVFVEVALLFNVVPRELIRWPHLRADVSLYDSSVMCASFVLLGIVVRRLVKGSLSATLYALAFVLLVLIVMALTRAVWLGLAVASVFLMVRFLDMKKLRRFAPLLFFLGFVGVFLAQNYASFFAFQEEHGVIAAKSDTIFDISRDNDLLFRILTGIAVFEEVASNASSLIFGVPHGTIFHYADGSGRIGEVIIHNAYLGTLVNAGVIGLVALVVLLRRALRRLRKLPVLEKGWINWIGWTIYACLIAMSANMMFNPNIGERQYVFSFLIGISLVVDKLVKQRGSAGPLTLGAGEVSN